MVPIYVEMVDLGLVDTYWSVILLYSALNLPFNMFLMSAFFRAIPDELLEAARVDGASIHTMFVRIMLPLSVPAIATLAIFNALYVWERVRVRPPLAPRRQRANADRRGGPAPGQVLLRLPGPPGRDVHRLTAHGRAVYLIFQKYLVRAISAGALK